MFMPPKPKHTRDEIIDTAFEIVRCEGIDALVARSLAQKLGTSSSPIFTYFSGMDELKTEVMKKAIALYHEKSAQAQEYSYPFKKFGLIFITFAKDEPKLFQMLFAHEEKTPRTFPELFTSISDLKNTCIKVIEEEQNLNHYDAEFLFDNIWIYAFGIAVLCANNVCSFTDEEINTMLGQQFSAGLLMIKEKNIEQWTKVPRMKYDKS